MSGANLAERVWETLARVWLGIRECCGDAAYERYLQAHTRNARGGIKLNREEFYLQQLEKRYSRVSRCC